MQRGDERAERKLYVVNCMLGGAARTVVHIRSYLRGEVLCMLDSCALEDGHRVAKCTWLILCALNKGVARTNDLAQSVLFLSHDTDLQVNLYKFQQGERLLHKHNCTSFFLLCLTLLSLCVEELQYTEIHESSVSRLIFQVKMCL